MKKLVERSGTRSTDLEPIEPEVLPPEEDKISVPIDPDEGYVSRKDFNALAEKLRIINFEYWKMSNAWMGFCTKYHPSTAEVEAAEHRGKEIIEIATDMAEKIRVGTHYICSVCKGFFEKGWSEDEANKESKELWGDLAEDQLAVICEDCFKRGMSRRLPR
jgi:hypothetical protein